MKARKYVFSGTSLSASDLPETGWKFCAPIRRGDLSRLEVGNSAVVLIVDGFFGSIESVDLTEIRENLENGVRLFGCSSMGALRAIEAREIGMVGLGTVFNEMKGSEIIDDAVVAQATCPETYRALSVSFVEIEYSIRVSMNLGEISLNQYMESCDCMRRIFYPLRTASKILNSLTGIMGAEISKKVLGRESIKHLDAKLAVSEIDKILSNG